MSSSCRILTLVLLPFLMVSSSCPICGDDGFHVSSFPGQTQAATSSSGERSPASLPTDLREIARYTSADLKSLLNDELGLHKMQFILDMLASQSEQVVKEKRLTFLSRKMGERMSDYANLIKTSEALESRLRHDLSAFLNESESNEPDFNRNTLDTPSFVYHRLDIIQSPPKLCKYFKQLATLEASTLFLAGSAFERPHEVLSSMETEVTTHHLMKFLTDCGNKSPNPGVRDRVRDDVMSISRISSTWRERSKTGNLSKYVVRRYIGTESGAFLVYPGAAIDRSYEATHRDWYRNAIRNPGRVILTAPYLDVGGSGYIVTLSHTIREGRYSKGQQEKVMGVMAMDFTLGYFHKLLLQSIAACQENMTCFLMDDKGYLLAHPSLIEPSGRGPVESTHLSHKEPLVANDLLNHKFFMKKKVCSSHSDCTLQRHYSLNMSMHSVLTNLVHGEHCSKYQITSIPESNIFIGIINKTCDTMTAFCPCSVVDRLCLNCHRMEQTDCECPCECPLETCPSAYSEDDLTPDSSCSPSHLMQELQLPTLELRSDSDVPSCFQVDCNTRRAESDCQGVLGCEWCQLDITGQPLKHKFCNFQRQCFGGVLGVRTPYADEISETMISEVPFSRVTPFTSIIFVLATCFVLLSFVVYCYRFHVHRVACALYVQDMRDGNVRMSQLDNEVDEGRDALSVQKPISNAGALLANIEAAAVVSPYRLNPGYRRPAGGGGDSDNGYSTMTAHEDSEHLGPDPLLLGKGVPASLTSISSTSGTSSPVGSNSIAKSLPMTGTASLMTKTTTAAAMTPFETSFNTQAQVHRLQDSQ